MELAVPAANIPRVPVLRNAVDINHILNPQAEWTQFAIDLNRDISTYYVEWETVFTDLPDANEQQMQMLVAANGDRYPCLTEKLLLFAAGDGPGMDISVDDAPNDKVSHVILVWRKRQLENGSTVRAIRLLRFKQIRAFSPEGLAVAVIIALASAFMPWAAGLVGPRVALGIGACTLVGKVAADYGLSEQDVAAIVAIKELQQKGIVHVNQQGHLDLV